MHVLELRLDEFNSVVFLNFAHEKDHKVEHLLHNDGVHLGQVLLLLEGLDDGRKPEVSKGLHTFQQVLVLLEQLLLRIKSILFLLH